MAGRDRRRERRASEEIDRGALGTLLKRKRDELGYSQDYVADQLSMPLPSYGKIERGETRRPSTVRLRAIARFFNLDPDEVMVAAGEVRGRQAADRLLAQLEPEAVTRLREMHNRLDPHLVKLTPAQFQVVLQTAEMWAEAAEIRQAHDPARDGTRPEAPQSSPEKTERPQDAPESLPGGCGR